MSSRVFQSVIVQMKEATDRVIGVIDADSNVISCSDTSLIGEKWPEAVIKLNSAPDSVVVVDKKTFKPLVSWSAYFDYAVFAEGDDETARSLCVMAYVALNGAKTYYEEKHDKGTFVKNIITDNILPGDIYIRAKPSVSLLSSKLQRTMQVKSLLPSTVAFTVVVPLPLAVRTPFSETVTIDSSLLCHAIRAPSGAPVTERVYCSPGFRNVKSSLFSANSAGSSSDVSAPTYAKSQVTRH